MTHSTTRFTGLSMPVFTAFGWAGEDTALKFALSQLEAFIAALHARLPRSVQERLPVFGLSSESQGVYLATGGDVESDAYIAFYARPMSLEILLTIKDKDVLAKGLKKAEKDLVMAHRLITELGPEWALRVQQMEIDEKTAEVLHYQDLFKDSVTAFDEETAAIALSKAAYLNSEERWVTPIYLSRRIPSEQVAAMGQQVSDEMAKHISELMPVFSFLSGRSRRKREKAKAKPRAKPNAANAIPVPDKFDAQESKDEFMHVAKLKPLHLRRGFVNLTPRHWAFFAVNSRTETRTITIYYDGIYDKGSSVWRLLPDGQARIVLSPQVHQWLEDHFSTDDPIQVVAKKLDDEEIQVSLKAVA